MHTHKGFCLFCTILVVNCMLKKNGEFYQHPEPCAHTPKRAVFSRHVLLSTCCFCVFRQVMCLDFQTVLLLEYCQFTKLWFCLKKINFHCFWPCVVLSMEIILYYPTRHDFRGYGSGVEPVSCFQKFASSVPPKVLLMVSTLHGNYHHQCIYELL